MRTPSPSIALSFMFGFVVCLGGVAPARATTLFVPGDCPTLAAAITAANLNSSAAAQCSKSGSGADTIELAADITLLAALPDIVSSIRINGNGHTIQRDPALFSSAVGGDGEDPCSGSGDKFRIFAVRGGGDLTLHDVSIKHGCATAGGDGTARGGGIANSGGRVSLDTVTVTRNTAFARSASSGGGIDSVGGTLTVVRSTIARNVAHAFTVASQPGSTRAQGGGVSTSERGTITVTNSTVAENTTKSDAVISFATGGSAMSVGGGVYQSESSGSLTNVTIAQNAVLVSVKLTGTPGPNSPPVSSLNVGAGVYQDFLAGQITMANTLIAENRCDGSPLVSAGNNVSDDRNCLVNATPSDQIVSNAGADDFTDDGAPGGGHVPLLAGSPAIDHGADGRCIGDLATDQLGQPRVGTCDVGAFESQTPPTCPATFSIDFSGTEYADCFRDLLRSADVNAGVDVGATGHTSLNLTGSTGTAASTWLAVYDDTPDTSAPGPTYGTQTVCADVLIERFNNTKGVGVVTLFNEGAGNQGLALLVYDAGNTDTLALATADGNPAQKGKLTNIRTLSLKGKVANKEWYRIVMTVSPTAANPTVTASVRTHVAATDPNSALGAELGSFTYTPAALPVGVSSTGQVGVIGTAVNAVVNSSITNFSNDPAVCASGSSPGT